MTTKTSKKMKVGFVESFLNIRGTSIALYDYAHFNEEILHNHSFVLTQPYEDVKEHEDVALEVYDKFKARFPVYHFRTSGDIQAIIDREKPDVLYVLKQGGRNGVFDHFENTKLLVHCVFDPRQPHGDLFTVISPWLNLAFGTTFPVLPHMVHLPDVKTNFRELLKIPEDAVVFGRLGG